MGSDVIAGWEVIFVFEGDVIVMFEYDVTVMFESDVIRGVE